MMHRVIEGKLQYANMYARMVENFPEGPLDPEGEKIRRDLSLEVVPLKQQKQIRRIFGEKILFLSKDHDCIPGPSARALRHLHDYRNETQHQDQVRSESIRPAVLILFDIATDLLVRLQPGTTSWVGGENYDWLKSTVFATTPAASTCPKRYILVLRRSYGRAYLLMRKESAPL